MVGGVSSCREYHILTVQFPYPLIQLVLDASAAILVHENLTL